MKKKIGSLLIALLLLLSSAFLGHHVILLQFISPNIELDEEKEEKEEQQFQKVNKGENSNSDTLEEIEELKLYANAAVLMDGENYRVLYEDNGYEELPMASTTKIMTCIVTLENGNLNDIVTISQYASTMPDVQLNVRAGEQYYLKDLLYSLMLESHNDVAVAIAEHIGGSVEGFATMMNQKALELGCEHTCFVTPNGLDADGHYTTAVELAKIASYAIKNEDFVEITNAASWQFQEIKSGRNYQVTNMDRFLYLYDGAIGVKTGFTNKAGYCFVGAVKKDGKTFVTSVLQCGWPPNRNYKWSDTTSLMDFGLENYQVKEVFKKNKIFDPLYVKDGKVEYVNLTCDGELSLLMSKYDKVTVEYMVPRLMDAPVVAHTMVGKAVYYMNGEIIEEFPIYTMDSVDKIDFAFCLNRFMKLWMLGEEES